MSATRPFSWLSRWLDRRIDARLAAHEERSASEARTATDIAKWLRGAARAA